MTIDDLILKLQEMKDKYGNLEISAQDIQAFTEFSIDRVEVDSVKKPHTLYMMYSSGDYYFDE